MWRSQDDGLTWDKSVPSVVTGLDTKAQNLLWLGKAFLWETQQGDLLSLARCRATALPALPQTPLPNDSDVDSVDRIAVFRSRDHGTHWSQDPELGLSYSEVFPSLCRLRNGQGLLTFTLSGLNPPLGLRGVMMDESSNGLSVATNADVLMLEQNTPADQPTGGGFGNTVQLADGPLVSASSFRDAKGNSFVEVLRWALP